MKGEGEITDQSEFWKIVESTKPDKLLILSDEEIRAYQTYFLEKLDSSLPAYESVTASLRLILLRGEIDVRHSDARHQQTQRLLRWAIRVGLLSAVIVLSAIVAIVFGIANRPTGEQVPTTPVEITETPAPISPTPVALPTTTPAPTPSPTRSAVSTPSPATQKKKTGRSGRARASPTPRLWRKLFKPKSSR